MGLLQRLASALTYDWDEIDRILAYEVDKKLGHFTYLTVHLVAIQEHKETGEIRFKRLQKVTEKKEENFNHPKKMKGRFAILGWKSGKLTVWDYERLDEIFGE